MVRHYLVSHNQAFIWYKKLADKEDSNGINYIGYCYLHGIGVKKDEKEAFAYYQKSANKEDPNGIFRVGFCYYHGIGVEMNKHKAFEHYLKLAEMVILSESLKLLFVTVTVLA